MKAEEEDQAAEERFPCSFAYWLEQCQAANEPLSQLEYLVPPHRLCLDGKMGSKGCDAVQNARKLALADDALTDFIGRMENLEEHLRQALLAAGNDVAAPQPPSLV